MCGPGSSGMILTNFRLCLLRKQNFLQEQLTTLSNYRLDRRRISTKLTDYETMSVRLNNTLRSKSFGLLSSRTSERFSNFMLTQGWGLCKIQRQRRGGGHHAERDATTKVTPSELWKDPGKAGGRRPVSLSVLDFLNAYLISISSTYRRQLQTSEAKLALSNKKAERRTLFSEQDLRAFVAEKVSLKENNTKLLEENAELRDEMEELRAMVELLKAQHMGKQGIVS